jgi:hypothetical protein
MVGNAKYDTNRVAVCGAIFASALLAILVVQNAALQASAATTTAADKIAVASSAMSSTPLIQATAGTSSQDITLLQGTVKTATPIDLIISHSQECAILTDVSLSSKNTDQNGYSTSSARAMEVVTVYIDGNPVPVASGDNGQVTFCDREYYVSTNILSQIQQLCAVTNSTCAESVFNSYVRTKDAHSFQWISLNVGSGTHTITVKAHLSVNVGGTGSATVVVGKRTMVVAPDHLANSVTI